jgi:hypothetical protein
MDKEDLVKLYAKLTLHELLLEIAFAHNYISLANPMIDWQKFSTDFSKLLQTYNDDSDIQVQVATETQRQAESFLIKTENRLKSILK